MSARKLGASWWCDFRWQFTRYRRRSPVNTKGGAQAYEIMLRRELMEHGNLDRIEKPAIPAATVPTFAEFAERWLRDYVDVNNKPSERVNKRGVLRCHLLPALGDRRLDAIDALEIECFKAGCRARKLSAKSINNALTVLRRCLRCTVEWGIVANIPPIQPLRAQPPSFRFLGFDEVERLVAAPSDLETSTMIATAAGTGLRFSELAALSWEDVDILRGEIVVSRSIVRGHEGNTKSYRVRHVPLPGDVLRRLSALSRRSRRVFPGPSGDAIRYELARHRLAQACRAAGIRRIGWHVLRHSYASELAARGGSLQAIRDLLGHSTIEMTQRYAHLAPNVLRDTVALLDDPAKNFGQQVGKDPLSRSPNQCSNACAGAPGLVEMSLNQAEIKEHNRYHAGVV